MANENVLPGPSVPAEVEAEAMSFEQAMAAVQAAISAPQAVAPVPPPPVVPPPPAPEAPPAPAAEIDPALRKILDYEATLSAKAKELESRAQQLADAETRFLQSQAATEQQRALFRRDPVSYLQSIDPEFKPGALAERLYFTELGDQAPVEHKVTAQTAAVYKDLDQVKAELAQLREAHAAEQQNMQIAQYRGELRSHEPPAEKAPIMSGLAKRNPARYEEILFAEARYAAQQSQGKKVLTPAEAVDLAEARLAAQRDEIFGPQSTPPTPTQPAAPTQTVFDRSIAAAVPPHAAVDSDDDDVLRLAALRGMGKEHLITAWKK